MELEFLLLDTQEEILVRDEKPGDMATCGSNHDLVKSLTKGQSLVLYHTWADDYFLDRGSYLHAIKGGAFGLLWFIALFGWNRLSRTEKAS